MGFSSRGTEAGASDFPRAICRSLARSTGLLLAVLITIGAAGSVLSAQENAGTHTLILRDLTLDEALREVVAVTGIDLIYGSEVAGLTDDRQVYCRAENEDAEGVLACVVRAAGLDYYRLSSGTYVVIAAPEDLPQLGSLTGLVTDEWTGHPLPNAEVRLQGPRTSAHANRAGLFTLSSLLPGRHRVVVTAPGYEPMAATVEVPPSGQVHRSFGLEPRPYETRPIVVDGLASRAEARVRGDGAQVDVRDLFTDSRGGGDYRRALPRVLGVSRRPLFSEVLVQGGEEVEQQLRLDGMPVYQPVAVEGLVGTFSPLSLESMTVHKAGFPARVGSATAGIVDLEHRLGGDGGDRVQVMTDPFNVNGRLSVPFGTGADEPGSVMVAARSSLWDLFRVPSLDRTVREWNRVDPLLARALQSSAPADEGVVPSEAVEFQEHGHGSEIRSSDIHMATRIPIDVGASLTASFYRGSNDIGTRLVAGGHHEGAREPDRIMLAEDGYDWSNLAGRLGYDGLLGDRTVLSVELFGTRHSFRTGYRMLQVAADDPGVDLGSGAATARSLEEELNRGPTLEDFSRVREIGGDVVLERSLGSRHQLLLGAEGRRVWGGIDLRGELLPRLGTALAQTRLTGVVEHRWSPGPVAVEGGFRSTLFPGAEEVVHEPRLAVEIEGRSDRVGPYSIRLAGGIYRQFVNRLELANPGPSALVPAIRFWLPSGEALEPPKAHHLALEGVIQPAPGWELRAEVFGRRNRGVHVIDYRALLGPDAGTVFDHPSEIVEPVNGTTYGAGLRLTRKGRRLRWTFGYDASRARRTYRTRFGGESVPHPDDAPHRGLVRIEYAPIEGLTFRARGWGTWGRSWALRQAYFDVLGIVQERPELGLTRPGDWTLPALLEVDLGVSWTGQFAGLDVELAADLQNAIDRDNVVDFSLRRIEDASEEFTLEPRVLTGITPTLTFRAAF